ncbi:conserved hypothetical protein [Pediculus humanus corporis]|uniref:Phosphofurin acidic cluster sorting protein 2 n=1 Tax=Pediculus humanus subsp. corporis TaxID=121224 RepID=E0VJ20_PEDHC|nr:uncharacterized protein Phum_PHUM237110 [Pediculus humanus corporis]EEB13376.1 conserved hypothetical protein [Pediculus humanus corporis]
MADKASKPPPTAIGKPVPMKLFATWEVDRTPPNCIPRLCSLTLSRLVVLRPLGAELASITVAVKMQSSKRILRSNEMTLPTNGLLDTELDLHFALQYPHFLKRDGNKLHVMLQRRKRYKNRTILGFKTLAEGVVNMSQQMDLELDLLCEGKEGKGGGLAARITVNSLCSQPVDQKHMFGDPSDRGVDYSDEDEEFASSQDEGEGEVEGSDSEPMLDESGRRVRKTQRVKMQTNARKSKLNKRSEKKSKKESEKKVAGVGFWDMTGLNYKNQEIWNFIKSFEVSGLMETWLEEKTWSKVRNNKFRQNEGLGPDQEDMDRKLSGGDVDPTEIEDFFEELEDLSESGPEMDTMSISSTPKPSLRPFFSSSRSLLHDNFNSTDKVQDRLSDESSKGGRGDSDSHPEIWTDQDASDPQSTSPLKDKESERKPRLFHRDRPFGKPKKSLSEHRTLTAPTLILEPAGEPKKFVVEQITKILGSDDSLPDHLLIISSNDPQGSLLASRLQERQLKVLPVVSTSEIRLTLTYLVNKIQKFCHSSAKPPNTIKLMVVGSDAFINNILRQYVDQLSQKPPEWQGFIKFLIVPLGSSSISRYLASVDSTYGAYFAGEKWRDLSEREINEVVNKIGLYMNNGTSTIFLPVAEAMLTYKEKSSDDESSQIFVPFVNDVRLGSMDSASGASVDLDDMQATCGSSPPKITPPSSPNVNSMHITNHSRESNLVEPLELQIDYWTSNKSSEAKEVGKGKDPNKSTLKTNFKAVQIQRIPSPGEQPGSYLLMNYITKEKKQKIMRLGKKKEKERETENKNQQIEGVTRLICSPKTQALPLKVSIDGVEWTGVKFFQLSAQWQTHIKTFPVALFAQDPS